MKKIIKKMMKKNAKDFLDFNRIQMVNMQNNIMILKKKENMIKNMIQR